MKTLFPILALISVLLTGCANPQYVSEIPEAVRQGVWGARDAAHAGDFASSERLLDATAQLVPIPKVKLKFNPRMTLQPVPNSAPIQKQVSVLPKDAPVDVKMFGDDSLWASPGAVAQEQQVDTFETKTVPVQQLKDEKQKEQLVVDNQKLEKENAGLKPYRSAIIVGLIIFALLIAAVIFIYLCKAGIVTGKLAATVASKFP